jgi:hypothetical protein
VFAIGGAAALACGTFGADGGGTPSPTDAAAAGDADATTSGNDAATTDAGTTDAADTGPPPTNLLVNGDFENGCNSWVPFEAALSVVSSGRDGGLACRVCTNHAATGLFSVTQSPAGPPAIGSTYAAEIWVRGAPGAGPTFSTVGNNAFATFRTRDDAGVTAEYAERGLLLKADWQKVGVNLSVMKVAATIDFYVYVDADGGVANTCFDVDDATVFKTP